MSHVGDIETSGGHGGGDEDGGSASPESVESGFTFALRAVTVNRSGVMSLSAEEVTQVVGHSLRLDEDQDQTARLLCKQEIKEERSLVLVVDVLDSLSNVLRGRTYSPDGEEDVVLEESPGEHLNLLGEGSGEHERLPVVNARHVDTLDNLPDLRLETHIQHSVGLVKDKVLDVGETDLAPVDEVDQSTGSSGKEITTSVKSPDLGADVGTTVHDGRSDPRSVGELPSFIVNLRDQLSGGGENQRRGVRLLPGVSAVAVGVDGGSGGSVAEESGQDWEKETTSLS